MNDPSNKQNHGTISEEDVSVILQRYTATTVLGLLQEVAQVQDVKIDWNLLAKRTTTGITNAREYQMLWRHLAYRDEFVEKVEDGVKPLDDDSDLEFELEAFPPVSNDASTEASACVKVLVASGSTSNSGLEKGLTIEAPLTINIPNGKSTGNSSENPQFASNLRGTNITVPVSVQKQPLPVVATSTEVLDTNGSGSGNLPPRRKRKPWSAAEDMELFAAVQKCGEGNWATILKGDFKGDRTASQLSQRWNIIKKRKSNSNVKGSQLSEVHLAARRALNLALDQPGVDSLKASSSIGRTKSNIAAITNTSMRPIISNTPSTTTLPHKQASEDTSVLTVTTKTFSKIRPKTSPKSLINGPDPVKAAAVAAGARIVTQSAAAAAMLNQQHLKSGVHIKKGVTNFRELHQPNVSRPLDRNPNIGVGPVAPSNAPSTATQEAKGTSISSSSNLPKKVQQDEAAAISAKVKAVQYTSEKQVKDVALPNVQTEIKKSVQNESAKPDQ
nr:telomeric repeat-binding factor like [Tanacetum cinerariifolium]